MVAGVKSPCGFWSVEKITSCEFCIFITLRVAMAPGKFFPCIFLQCLELAELTPLYFVFYFLFSLFSLREYNVLKCREPPVPISISSQHHKLLWALRLICLSLVTLQVHENMNLWTKSFYQFFFKTDTWPLGHDVLWPPPVALSSVLLLGFIT